MRRSATRARASNLRGRPGAAEQRHKRRGSGRCEGAGGMRGAGMLRAKLTEHIAEARAWCWQL